MRAAYYLGHIASHNPNFTEREFEAVEPELADAWNRCGDTPCEWTQARAFVGEGYRRGARRTAPDQRTIERADELERRLEDRRAEETGEVF